MKSGLKMRNINLQIYNCAFCMQHDRKIKQVICFVLFGNRHQQFILDSSQLHFPQSFADIRAYKMNCRVAVLLKIISTWTSIAVKIPIDLKSLYSCDKQRFRRERHTNKSSISSSNCVCIELFYYSAVKNTILDVFAGPADKGIYSPSVQQTQFLTQKKILLGNPQVEF